MKKILSTVVCILMFTTILIAQEDLVKIPLNQKVLNSSQIVEGVVVDKQSFWDADHHNIYTINTVEVYKVFKGQILNTVKIVTPGGRVGIDAQTVTPSLQLNIGDIGTFTLHQSKLNFKEDKSEKLKPYSGIQGFYKYDIKEDAVISPFYGKRGITTSFYNDIKELTKSDFKDVNKFNFNNKISDYQSKGDNRFSSITNISPTTISSGTKSILTITGTNFGTFGPASEIEFRNANSGGDINGIPDYISALDSDVVNWTPTEIQVEVPSLAGTGNIRVTTNTGGLFFSSQTLTVEYSHINFITDVGTGNGQEAFQTRHIDTDGSGGYTWRMHSDFNNNAAAKASFLRAFNTWRCESGVNWINGAITTTDASASDTVNIIRFDNGSELPVGTLGVCISRFDFCINGTEGQFYVEELDIVFNDTQNWQFGPSDATGSQFDFETVAVHELGHGHQLGHVINNSQIMHYALGPADNNRDLSANDIAGSTSVQTRSTTMPVCGTSPMTDYMCGGIGLSTIDFELSSAFSLYPNPTRNNINILNRNNFTIQSFIIYDVNGKQILKNEINSTQSFTTIDVSKYASGLYFFKISTTKGEINKKVLIQ